MGLYINGIEYSILDPSGFLDMDINPYCPILNNPQPATTDDCSLKDASGTYITIKKEDE